MINTKSFRTKKGVTILYLDNTQGEVTDKQCVRCLSWRKANEFPKLPGSFANLHNNCRPCEAERAMLNRRALGVKPLSPTIETDNGVVTKRCCSKCKFLKDLTEYDLNPSGTFGHDSECSECKRRRGELYRRDKGIHPQRVVPVLRNEQGEVTHRECTRCLNMEPLERFTKHKIGYLGIHPYCKTCATERHLIAKYGLTLKDREELYATQGNGCAICKDPVDIKAIHVDHCHTTGVTRGLLCNSCNTALGHVRENEQICENMIEYIRYYNAVADRHSK